jgi:hypothetical protein
MDQKIEILKIAGKDSPINLKETYRGLLSLLTEDRCRKCRDSLKNVINELEGIRANRMNPGVVEEQPLYP